ncbi:MAG: hypothetical protein A2V65_12265 [Deltaproteobacteria bacterium RBG_13_49_15]|nr:MAG: hypothetical protein A2V65_12265 [Deltaproteobacteria bacterium RBG_13_49_15]
MNVYLITWSILNAADRLGLSLSDLPGFSADLGFEGVEISDRQIASCDSAYLRSFARTCARTDIGIILDISCDLTLLHPQRAEEEMRHAGRMIRLAQQLGARGVRIWLGGQTLSIQQLYYRKRRIQLGNGKQEMKSGGKTANAIVDLLGTGAVYAFIRSMQGRASACVFHLEKKIRNAVFSLKEIVKTIGSSGLFVAIENHWGISSYPEIILDVIRKVDSKHLGTCVDFVNFPKRVNPEKGIRQLAPYAFIAHAKRGRPAGDGNGDIDFQRSLSVLKGSGFDGILAAEHDGPGDGLKECMMIQKLIRNYWF